MIKQKIQNKNRSEAINQIESVLKEIIVKVLVESQQKLHEFIFLPEEVKRDDSEGLFVFVDVVFKEIGGVQRRFLQSSIITGRKNTRCSIFFVLRPLDILVADAFPTARGYVKYLQQLLLLQLPANSFIKD